MSEKVPKILITDGDVPKIALDLLGSKCELVINNELPRPTRQDIMAKAPGVDAIFWITKETLDKEILDAAGPQMKVVGTMSAGVNHIDVGELKRRGIKLGNTPQVLNDAVADAAVFLALGASRRSHEGRLKMERGEWVNAPQWMLGQDINGSTVGIVGLGGIGQTIVKRLKAFDVAKFLYTGHNAKPEGEELGAEFVTFDKLLEDSDFVICSCPLTGETQNMFNEKAFAKMKKTAIFVNIGRGGVVYQPDLIKALKEGAIFAAGLDVMTPEPLPSNHELLTLPNCVLLPHLGSATFQTRQAMAQLTAQNILRGLAGEEMFTPVV